MMNDRLAEAESFQSFSARTNFRPFSLVVNTYIRSLRACARRFMAVTLMHDRRNAVCAFFLMPIEQEPPFHVDLACRVETKLL